MGEVNNMSEHKKGFFGYWVAFGCFLIMCMHLGMLYSISIFIPAIANGLKLSVSSIAVMVSIATGTAFFSFMVAGNVIARLTAKWTLFIATILCALHFYLYSISTGLPLLYFSAGIGGLVIGFGTTATCAAIIAQWFIEKRSAVVGFVFGGAAVGGSGGIMLAGLLIHQYSWQFAYVVLATALLVIGLLANILLIRDPKKMRQKPLGWEKEQEMAAKNAVKKDEIEVVPGVDLKTAFRSPSLWFFILAGILIGTLSTGFQSFGPAYWQSHGMAKVTSAGYMSMSALFGAVATMLAGLIAEKFGNRVFVTLVVGGYVLGIIFLLIWPGSMSNTFVLLGIICMGIAQPSSTSLPATVTTESFGSREYAKIVSYILGGIYFGKAAIPIVMGLMLKSTGSYVSGWIMVGIFGAVGLLLTLIAMAIAPMKKKRAEELMKEQKQAMEA